MAEKLTDLPNDNQIAADESILDWQTPHEYATAKSRAIGMARNYIEVTKRLRAATAELRQRLADWKQLAVANAAVLEALHAAEGDGTALCDSMKAAILEAIMRTRAALQAAKGE